MRMRAFDGKTWTVYQIEGQFPKRPHPQYSLRWCTRELSPAHFGERHAKHGESWEKVMPFYTAYTANGMCWQATGLDGFLDKDFAVKAFSRIMKYAPPNESVQAWRLVRRIITVQLDELVRCNAGLVTT